MTAPLERLRQPEYTGTNRCLPCTVLNLVITAAVGALVAVVSIPAAIGVVAICVAVISLRGYLVPGTPELTRRYVPAGILRAIGKQPDGGAVDTQAASGEALVEFCLEAGILEGDGDDVFLTEDFRRTWNERIEAVRDQDERAVLADVFDSEPESLTVEVNNEWFVVYRNGEKLTHWRSTAAFVADVAADRALAAWTDEWQTFDQQQRGQILGRLRIMLLDCPLCDHALDVRQTTGCCPGEEAIVADCPGCGTTVFESSV
ncbi:hypothetical protein [Natrialba sp. INN-245]|uniref:hypothetical protein n=1 Tax=Natrialba sp. INN-245 TaxID=2690967 RepID=UPI00131261A1|nr:hypothetical protein [Natrialba sp. INN-245]MWV40393.1 hypothetical protein [Natrialba sp. INN-245]